MPSVSTSRDLAAMVRRAGMAAQRAQVESVNRGTLILKRSIEAELTMAVGPDHRMRNLIRRKGATPPKLSVGFNVKGINNPTALLTARGPWGAIEYPIGEHMIHPRLATTGTGKGMSRAARIREARQRQLNQTFGAAGTYAGLPPMPVAPGRYSYRAQHPGTRGKRPFGRGLAAAIPRAQRELNAVITGAVAREWRNGRQWGATATDTGGNTEYFTSSTASPDRVIYG